AGKSDVAARLLSVLIGTATIPLLYALARVIARSGFRDEAISKSQAGDCFAASRLATLAPHASAGVTNSRVALFAALVLALAPFHVYYSQQVRMYGLVTLLGLASVYLFIRLLEMTPGKLKTALVALAYILVTTAALYTQYYAAFIIAFQISGVLFLTWRDRRPATDERLASRFSPLAHWLTAWSAIALLYLPWVIYAGPKLYAYVTAKVAIEKYPPLDPITFLAQHLTAFSVGHVTAWTSLAWASVVVIALAVVGSIQVYRVTCKQGNKSLVHLPTWLLASLSLLVPLALGYLVNLVYPFHPVHGERLLLFAAPAFYLLVALGINALWERRALLGALVIIVVAIISALSLA
ncbi:MAG: hypothetical protein L0Y55_18015, partial [Anaerolineales bacterium]|nr:hypothetical protein [Anaerolineales bacterium]